jgi:hypothetical protein
MNKPFDLDELDGAAKDWNEDYLRGLETAKFDDTPWSHRGDYSGGLPLLMPVTLSALLKMKLQARASILDRLLHDRCVIMAFAWRGVGKTWFALGHAYAIATGGKFLKWKAPQARRVLYIDGEMPAIGLASAWSRLLPRLVASYPMRATFGFCRPTCTNSASPTWRPWMGRRQSTRSSATPTSSCSTTCQPCSSRVARTTPKAGCRCRHGCCGCAARARPSSSCTTPARVRPRGHVAPRRHS